MYSAIIQLITKYDQSKFFRDRVSFENSWSMDNSNSTKSINVSKLELSSTS